MSTGHPAARGGTLRVAMIGYGFMGAAHSQGWRTAQRFFDLPLATDMAVVVGRNQAKAEKAAARLGWREAATDWREVIRREDIDLVDICTPSDSHAEIAIAALRAGKHVLCEKPLANTVEEAEAMADAAAEAAGRGVVGMVGFTYRRLPATALARELIAAGQLGSVRQARAVYLQDWLASEDAPLTWRLDKAVAGSGALGDLGAHIVDMVQYVTGENVAAVSGLLRTFVTERPVLGSAAGLSGTAGTERGPVTVDDAALFTGRLSGGGVAAFEATRMATGRKNALRFEISGTEGAIAFDLERLNELELYTTSDGASAGFRRILATEPEHPYAGAWWPAGHGLGYEHGFSNQVRDLVESIAAGEQPAPSFADGLHVQRVLDAVERSSEAGSAWLDIHPLERSVSA